MKFAVSGLAVLMLAVSASGDPVKLPKKKNFHLFLLAGQSNMAGRGEVADVDRETHPRVVTLNRDGEWVPAADPIHFDKRGAGVGPGRSFGISVAEANSDITVGLIPSATGGSPIDMWAPGMTWKQTRSNPYDDAIARARKAMRKGKLQAILWHQGEGDVNPEMADAYKEKLTTLVARFRKDLGIPDLPIIIGQLGQFPQNPWTDATHKVDAAHKNVAENDPNIAFVSSNGLTCKPDNIHFNTPSMREFGQRYAEAYGSLVDKRAGEK